MGFQKRGRQIEEIHLTSQLFGNLRDETLTLEGIAASNALLEPPPPPHAAKVLPNQSIALVHFEVSGMIPTMRQRILTWRKVLNFVSYAPMRAMRS